MLSIPLDQAETLPDRWLAAWLNLPPPPIDWLVQQARECRPDLAAFRIGVLRARAEVNLAKANRIDDLFLLYQPFTAQRRLSPGERTSYSWALGVTVPLPVFNRNQGNIARANHTVAQTQIQAANLDRQVLLEVQRAEAAYSVTLATIKKLQEEILPAARENLEMSLADPGPDEPGAISRIEAQRVLCRDLPPVPRSPRPPPTQHVPAQHRGLPVASSREGEKTAGFEIRLDAC